MADTSAVAESDINWGDNSVPEDSIQWNKPNANAVKTAEPSTLSKIGNWVNKQGTGIVQRNIARGENIQEPTVLGKAVNSTIDYLHNQTPEERQTNENFAGAPERLYRTAAAAAGDILDPMFTPLLSAAGYEAKKSAKNIGDANKEFISHAPGAADAEHWIGNQWHHFTKTPVATALVQSAVKAGKSVKEWYDSQPPEVKANLKASGDLSSLIGIYGGGAITEGPVQSIERGVAKKLLPLADKLEEGANAIQARKVKLYESTGGTPENYSKYGVFGNAAKVQAQWNTKIKNVASNLDFLIKKQLDNPENFTSVNDVFSTAEKNIAEGGLSQTEKKAALKSLSDLKTEYSSAYPDGKINILDAQLEKRAVGRKGDWISKNGSPHPNRDAGADIQAYNNLYDALKTNVENKGGPEIKQLNKQLSDMIPMERAASKQVLVSDRKGLIGLDDFLGGMIAVSHLHTGNPLPLIGEAANLASKAPWTAKGMYNISQGIKNVANPVKNELERWNPPFDVESNSKLSEVAAPKTEADLKKAQKNLKDLKDNQNKGPEEPLSGVANGSPTPPPATPAPGGASAPLSSVEKSGEHQGPPIAAQPFAGEEDLINSQTPKKGIVPEGQELKEAEEHMTTKYTKQNVDEERVKRADYKVIPEGNANLTAHPRDIEPIYRINKDSKMTQHQIQESVAYAKRDLKLDIDPSEQGRLIPGKVYHMPIEEAANYARSYHVKEVTPSILGKDLQEGRALVDRSGQVHLMKSVAEGGPYAGFRSNKGDAKTFVRAEERHYKNANDEIMVRMQEIAADPEHPEHDNMTQFMNARGIEIWNPPEKGAETNEYLE